jgi:hypothetical protein
MILPELLKPSGIQAIVLPSGRRISVAKATPSFSVWRGFSPADTYNGKQILDFGGRPAFAELAILWTMAAAGWQGVWIDTYRRAYRDGYWGVPPITVLPAEASAILKPIWNRAGSWSGTWDVFCWGEDDVLFLESKRRSRDAIRASQVHWLAAALDVGLEVRNFLVVEWSAV